MFLKYNDLEHYYIIAATISIIELINNYKGSSAFPDIIKMLKTK